MRKPEGESDRSPLRPCFDRRLKLEFHGSRVTSDAGLLAYRELDDALGLTVLASDVLADSRTGKNGWHGVVGLLRQSVVEGGSSIHRSDADSVASRDASPQPCRAPPPAILGPSSVIWFRPIPCRRPPV